LWRQNDDQLPYHPRRPARSMGGYPARGHTLCRSLRAGLGFILYVDVYEFAHPGHAGPNMRDHAAIREWLFFSPQEDRQDVHHDKLRRLAGDF